VSSVAEEEVVGRLESFGVPRENLFLVHGDDESEGLIMLWHPEIGARYIIIERDSLAKACYAYLFQHGARRFASELQLLEAARTEQWPGWDTCEDLLRARKAVEYLHARQAPPADRA
jgi:hypothetical protein